MGIWYNLRLHCIWNTIFWQNLMIFLLLVLDFIAWFSHPGLWKIRLKWPLFAIERLIFEKSKSSLYSSANSCSRLWSSVVVCEGDGCCSLWSTAALCLIFMIVFSLFVHHSLFRASMDFQSSFSMACFFQKNLYEFF